jgi:hypothetical protein
VVTVQVLSATQTAPDGSGAATINSTTSQVVITNPDQAVNITIADGTDNPTIDVSAFITNGTGILPAIIINSNVADVSIPDGTTVTSASTTWNGVIAAPTVTTITLPPTSGQTKTLSTAIEIGFTGVKLSFDKGVSILLPGQAGKRVGYVRTGIDFTEITTVCGEDSQTWADTNLVSDGDCKIDMEPDLVIWTKHFTTFAAYTQTTNAPSYSGHYVDSTAPTISDIEVIRSATTATITWTTNESSLSWVVYGTSTAYGLEKKTTTYVTSHSLTLTGLTSETTYHYQVKSKDSAGNIRTYTDKTFTTLATGLAPEPEPVTGPMTADQLRAEILRITTLIAQLQAKLAELLGEAVIEGIPAGFSFENNLEIGDISTDAKYLQIVLNSDPVTRLAESGVGSPGNETNYFGPLTKSAVIKFQEKYADKILASWGLTSGTGYVGSTTRAQLNKLLK